MAPCLLVLAVELTKNSTPRSSLACSLVPNVLFTPSTTKNRVAEKSLYNQASNSPRPPVFTSAEVGKKDPPSKLSNQKRTSLPRCVEGEVRFLMDSFQRISLLWLVNLCGSFTGPLTPVGDPKEGFPGSPTKANSVSVPDSSSVSRNATFEFQIVFPVILPSSPKVPLTSCKK